MTYDLTYTLHEVAPYINWLYFFHTWGFPARLGSIASVHGCEACRQNWLQGFALEEQTRAREAMKLFDEAQQLLRELDKTYHTHARVVILPAYSDGDDIVLEGTEPLRLPMLRQQNADQDGFCWCLSDFLMPKQEEDKPEKENTETPTTSSENPDHFYREIGLFVSTIDKEMEEQTDGDNYQHLLHQTLADRLAEATAERMHEEVRTRLWGYAPNEHHTMQQLFREEYQGKRPAIGYPSLPDQSLNFLLDKVLDFSSLGVHLTENGAMKPHASTSGLLFAHPKAKHFSVGPVAADQLSDYANRKGMTVEQVQKFIRI